MKTIFKIAVAALILVAIVWIAKPTSQNNTASLSTKSNGTLTVEETNNYDFGNISMAAGKVTHRFEIKNTGPEPVTIEKIYTSCMCTDATLLMKSGERLGPYGMPGHGFIPKVNQVINPEEKATVEAVFDPAAHGPAGVGKIQRVITIENNAGQPVELQFTAVVNP